MSSPSGVTFVAATATLIISTSMKGANSVLHSVTSFACLRLPEQRGCEHAVIDNQRRKLDIGCALRNMQRWHVSGRLAQRE